MNQTIEFIYFQLDGVIARNFRNQMSALGTALDPLADKILITVLTVTLTTAKLLPGKYSGSIWKMCVFLFLISPQKYVVGTH